MMVIGANGRGKTAFGALQAEIDLGYSKFIVHFAWMGDEEMDEADDDGHAELLDDGTIEITFAYHNGDDAVLKVTHNILKSDARETHPRFVDAFGILCRKDQRCVQPENPCSPRSKLPRECNVNRPRNVRNGELHRRPGVHDDCTFLL